MSSITSELTHRFRSDLMMLLPGRWVIVETSECYIFGRVRTIDPRNLNILLEGVRIVHKISTEEIVLSTEGVLVRGSEVKNVILCSDENQCRQNYTKLMKLSKIEKKLFEKLIDKLHEVIYEIRQEEI